MEIVNATITPMLRLVLEYSPVEGAESYLIKLLRADQETPVEESTASTLYRLSEPLRNATWYFLQVQALDASEAILESSEVQPLWTVAQGGTAPLLRQAAFDAIDEAGLPLCSKNFMARAWGRTTAPSGGLPAVEIGMPRLEATQPESSQTQVNSWAIPITLRFPDDKQDPDNQAAPWLLFEMVQGAIDDSEGLKLTRFGVMPELWSWSAELDSEGERSRQSVINAVLTVPVRKHTGIILLPQPATIPEQPETPLSL